MKDVGPLEERLLELLWRRPGGASVREAQAALPGELAYTTVMTTLDRLYKKGLLAREREGRAFRYAARTSEDAYRAGLLRRWLERLLRRGSARPLLSTLVEAVGERDRQLLPELERLVREKKRTLARGRG